MEANITREELTTVPEFEYFEKCIKNKADIANLDPEDVLYEDALETTCYSY